MKTKIASELMLALILISMVTLAFEAQRTDADPKTIVVPDDYPTIQEAVDASSAGDTVYVRAGEYYECVVMHKSISLIGENRDTTTIYGDHMGVIVHVLADNVTISGFTIEDGIYGIFIEDSSNSFISDNNIIRNCNQDITIRYGSGIYIDDSPNCLISENNLRYNFEGIHLENSSKCVVSGNDITGNDYGILLWGTRDSFGSFILNNSVYKNDYGITISGILSCTNVLRNNNMTNNGYNFGFQFVYPRLTDFIQDIDSTNTVDGKPIYYWVNQSDKKVPSDAGYVAIINSTNIAVENLTLTSNWQGVVFAYTTNSTIKNITATTNSYGICLIHSSSCHVSGNNINSNDLGIALYCSFDNVIYHNNFVDNKNQVMDSAGYANSWDDGYPSGGNYWSNYKGIDWYRGPYQNETGSDGIGDEPYIINAENIDNYPLMKPYPWDPHDIGITRVESKTVIGQGFNLHINVTIFNYGSFAETFNVSLYANTTLIQTQTTTLTSKNSTTMTFTWNTTSVTKGNYTLKIIADTISDETATSDNTFNSWIVITIPGDINGDFKCEGKDNALVAKAYDTRPGDPRWIANADINCDNRVEGKDIAIVAKNYGKSG